MLLKYCIKKSAIATNKLIKLCRIPHQREMLKLVWFMNNFSPKVGALANTLADRKHSLQFPIPTISQLHYYSNWMYVKMQCSSNSENLLKGTSHLWTKVTFNLLFRKQGAQDIEFRETFENLFPEMHVSRCRLNFDDVTKCPVKSEGAFD